MSSATGNAALFRRLANRADEVALSVSSEKFPILLRELAKRRRITGVEFQPLLVDAMLTTHTDGFRVLFNSGNRDPKELKTRYYGENEQQLTDNRIRFSLAHEFAHTLFYDLKSNPPKIAKAFRAGGGKTALENLERNCDRLAAHLLLPTRLFEAVVLNMKEISADTLRDLAREAGVSVEVIIRRLGTRSALLRKRYFFGCIAMIRHDLSGVRIRAVSIPHHLDVAHELQLIQPGEQLQLRTADGVAIDLGDMPAISEISLMTAAARQAQAKPYRMQITVVDRFRSEVTYLVILEEIRNH
jgi:IrrE N-terminal-like domain